MRAAAAVPGGEAWAVLMLRARDEPSDRARSERALPICIR